MHDRMRSRPTSSYAGMTIGLATPGFSPFQWSPLPGLKMNPSCSNTRRKRFRGRRSECCALRSRFALFVAGTLPPVLAAGGENPSLDSPWWRFRTIRDLVAKAPERLAPIAWKHFRPLEAAMLERCAEVSHQAARLHAAARAKLLGAFMAQNIVRVLNAQSAAESELTYLAS
jgi:hypothetical protein